MYIKKHMKIGILSDTHRNTSLHEKALEFLVGNKKIDRVYHLGDDYRDAEMEINRRMDLLRVPGIYCPEYKDRSADRVVFDTILGVNVVMAHDRQDITDENVLCNDIILYGHYHKHEIRVENGKLYLNPGHLKGPKDKNQSPSFGFLDIDFGEIFAAILGMDGKALLSMKLKKGETGLYKI
jgi:putative phosphoesterase